MHTILFQYIKCFQVKYSNALVYLSDGNIPKNLHETNLNSCKAPKKLICFRTFYDISVGVEKIQIQAFHRNISRNIAILNS